MIEPTECTPVTSPLQMQRFGPSRDDIVRTQTQTLSHTVQIYGAAGSLVLRDTNYASYLNKLTAHFCGGVANESQYLTREVLLLDTS